MSLKSKQQRIHSAVVERLLLLSKHRFLKKYSASQLMHLIWVIRNDFGTSFNFWKNQEMEALSSHQGNFKKDFSSAFSIFLMFPNFPDFDYFQVPTHLLKLSTFLKVTTILTNLGIF